MLPTFIYPISYTLIDTFLVVFIKATSVAGKTSYNTVTINAITEFIKLCIAIYISHNEGSLHSLRQIVNQPGLLVRFLIPNLMYAVNNNLFHYSVSALPPAVFVVAINAFRTVFTALLQPCVSNQALSNRQLAACVLLVCSFICASMPEVIKAAFNGTVKGSLLELLIYLSMTYSVISVSASLSQEKLLKDSKSLMVANIINYSIGILFQVIAMIYQRIENPDEDLFRGLNIFWIKMIPCLMALVGLSISYVLKYFDNIVKLICSSISVLLVNSITCYLSGDTFINIYFFTGWLLTLPATYLYYVKPVEQASSSVTKKDDDEKEDKLPLLPEKDVEKNEGISNGKQQPQSGQSNKVGLGAVVGSLFLFSILSSSFEIGSLESKKSEFERDIYNTCPIYEVPISDSRSNMRVVNSYNAKYTHQFSHLDDFNGNVYVACSGDLFLLGPDTAQARALAENDKWKKLDRSSLEMNFDRSSASISHESAIVDDSYSILPWTVVDSLYGEGTPYYWLSCSSYPDYNLVVRPPISRFQPRRKDLLPSQKKDIADYIKYLSVDIGGETPSGPLFDTVLIIYFDAVSRVKLHHFYKRTISVLESLSLSNPSSDHVAIELERFHSLGINSERNYPQLLAGVSAADTKQFYSKRTDDPSNSASNFSSIHKREPWLFDIAEEMGYTTLGATTECYHYCKHNCYEDFNSYQGYEVGGFYRQYLGESDNRFPGAYNFPASTYCESLYRHQLTEKGCSTCKSIPLDPEDWIGNKLGLSYVFDWWRVWLSSHGKNSKEETKDLYTNQKRFATIIFEESHQEDFYKQFDLEYGQFLSDLLLQPKSKKYRTENTAVVVLADHGLHFMPEFKLQTGKVANKQPHGFLILPKSYLENHPEQAQNLYRNAKALTTPYDVRATVQYWLTGKDWGAVATKKMALGKTANDPSFILHHKIYASRHGYNMMTSRIESNRTCEMAGVPSEFCGCHLFPCDSKTKTMLKGASRAIANYINHKIADINPEAVSVCKPLMESEIIFAPGMEDCLAGKHTVVVNAFIQRRMRLISVTFTVEHGSRLVVQNVNTITPYGKIWSQCAAKLSANNIPDQIPEENHQFCHCVEDSSALSTLAGIVNALNF